MSENPYSTAQSPPFGSNVDKPTGSVPANNPLMVPAIILIVLSSFWLMYGVFNIIVVFGQGPPPVPAGQGPAIEMGQKAGYFGAAFMLPILSAFTLLGGIQMLRMRSFAVCVAGAIASLVPVCGPCFGLTMPFGIWALVLLFNPDVRRRFQ